MSMNNLVVHHYLLCDSEMLAWASAQIHCQFHASENRVALPAQGNKQDVQADSDTVLIPSRGEYHSILRGAKTPDSCVTEQIYSMCFSLIPVISEKVFHSKLISKKTEYLGIENVPLSLHLHFFRRTRAVCAGHTSKDIILRSAP
ncbi:hypothetical protein AMECASPLE_038321 [Ameca splendens]|uniref:Uncharacterized protein n=1 Tax=Ameca splendens TaxID=208324 RepID=A0ABV1AF74_9TELE